VVPFPWLRVSAVLAVAVGVHLARTAGHTQLGARGGNREVAGPGIGGHLAFRAVGRRGERVLVGLRRPVEPYARGLPGGPLGYGRPDGCRIPLGVPGVLGVFGVLGVLGMRQFGTTRIGARDVGGAGPADVPFMAIVG
jgi:hypothetical protein